MFFLKTMGEIESMLVKNGEPFIQLDKEKKWFWHLDPMGQVSGPRSSGKTFFLYYLMLSVAEIGADIYILDPKSSDFSSLKYCYPESERESHVATTPNSICKVLRELTELMNDRYEKYFQISSSTLGFDAQKLGLRPIFIFFDEVLSLIEEDKKLGKEAEQYLKQIILKGRQSGIYIIISSQRLSADVLNTVIRENCGLRVIFGKVQEESYRMALGESFKKLPRAEKGVGKGYIYLDGQGWQTPKAFIAPYMDSSKMDIKQIFKNLLNNPPKVYKE